MDEEIWVSNGIRKWKEKRLYGVGYCGPGSNKQYLMNTIYELEEDIKKKNREISGLKRRNNNLIKKGKLKKN